MADNPAYNSERYGGVPVPAVRMKFSMRGLQAELEELERTDPDVAKAAASYDRMVEDITGRTLPPRVIPDDVDRCAYCACPVVSHDDEGCTACACTWIDFLDHTEVDWP